MGTQQAMSLHQLLPPALDPGSTEDRSNLVFSRTASQFNTIHIRRHKFNFLVDSDGELNDI